MQFGKLILPALLALSLKTVDGATINASSAAYVDVASAVGSATYGDTVGVPAGSSTWTNLLTVTKGIHLLGAGSNVTTITSSQTTAIRYNPDTFSVTSNVPFSVRGFTFDGNGSGNAGGFVRISNTSTTAAISKVIVANNRFYRTYGRSLYFDGEIHGVVFGNLFESHGTWFVAYGIGRPSWDNFEWTLGQNALVFEDNVLDGADGVGSGAGGSYVVRYNTWSNIPSFGMLDIHGNQPGSIYAARGAEIYGNFMVVNRNEAFVDIRGGETIVFNNVITGTGSPVDIRIREEYADDGTDSPCNSCTQHVNRTYIWNNTVAGTLVDGVKTQDIDPPVLAENAQYWNGITPFTGEIGIGRGSELPALSPTNGVGYWVSSDTTPETPPSTLEEAKTYCQSGRLYVAEDGAWVLRYAPFTYPHPLRGASATAGTVNVGTLNIAP